jgi:hypothetical protein
LKHLLMIRNNVSWPNIRLYSTEKPFWESKRRSLS